MGCGSATPQQIINNDQLGQRVDTNDEWIKSRTGIRQRRVVGKNKSLIESIDNLFNSSKKIVCLRDFDI